MPSYNGWAVLDSETNLVKQQNAMSIFLMIFSFDIVVASNPFQSGLKHVAHDGEKETSRVSLSLASLGDTALSPYNPFPQRYCQMAPRRSNSLPLLVCMEVLAKSLIELFRFTGNSRYSIFVDNNQLLRETAALSSYYIRSLA